VFHGLFPTIFRRDLRRERGAFPGPFEPLASRAGPRDGVSLGIRNGDNRIVKRRLNMRDAVWDILFYLLFAPATSWFSHKNLPEKTILPFLLALDTSSRALSRSCVGMRALSPNRQTPAMAETTIAADIHQHLDVCRNLTPEIPLNLVVSLDLLVDLPNLIRGEFMHALIPIDIGRIQDLLSGAPSDPVDIGQTDLYPFAFW